MSDVSFSYVPAEGYTAFAVELQSGQWSSIDVSAYAGADGRPIQALGTAPAFVVLKLQMLGCVVDVTAALESTGSAKGCDNRWDGLQKRLNALVNLGLLSSNPTQKAAAERLQKTLLLGRSGEGQTKLKYQQEVDFGRKQLQLTSDGQGAADVVLLGLGSTMADIGAATNALAAAIGHGTTGLAPAMRKRAAAAACAHTFGSVYKQLDWLVNNGQPGADKEKALALRAPLMELAARYPAKPEKQTATTAPTVAPA